MTEEADEMTEKECRQNAGRLRFFFPPRTWRGRLFAWLLLLLWVVIAVVGGLEWTFLRAQLWEAERSDTATRLATLRALAEAATGDEEEFVRRLSPLLYPEESLTLQQGDAVLVAVPAADPPDPSSPTLRMDLPLSWEGRPATLELVHPLERAEQVFAVELWTLAAAGGIGLIVAAVGAAIAAGWVLRPVRALLSAVRRVEGENFSTRVPVPPGEDELTALSRAFNRMMDRVEAAFERERRFTADAAHELRTPLAAILGHVRLLRRWGKDDPRRLEDGLRAIEAEAERLERLVGQLLALSRLERGLKEEVAGTCEGRAVLEAIARDAATAYPDVRFRLLEDPAGDPAPATVPLACGALRQLLWILLDNAVRHGRPVPPAEPTVDLALFREANAVVLSVRDRGPGIPPEWRERVFERFFRGDAARSRGGFGLGLALAREIVAASGGRIALEAAEGGGTRVVIRWDECDRSARPGE